MLILDRALDEENEIFDWVAVTDRKIWTETILLMTKMTMMNSMGVFGFVFLAFFLAWLNSSFEVACFYAEAEEEIEVVFVGTSVEHVVIKCFFRLPLCIRRHRNQNQNLS